MRTGTERETGAALPLRQKRLRKAIVWLRALVVAALIVSLLQTFAVQLAKVRSISMQPTLYERDWLLVDKLAFAFGHPQRGDVVILKEPLAERDEDAEPVRGKLLVKRVVGVPGDRLEARNGVLYVNGRPAEEPYTDAAVEDGDMGPVTVRAGFYFVMGDNRHWGASLDSRTFGEVPETGIKARADLIVWPVWHWNLL